MGALLLLSLVPLVAVTQLEQSTEPSAANWSLISGVGRTGESLGLISGNALCSHGKGRAHFPPNRSAPWPAEAGRKEDHRPAERPAREAAAKPTIRGKQWPVAANETNRKAHKSGLSEAAPARGWLSLGAVSQRRSRHTKLNGAKILIMIYERQQAQRPPLAAAAATITIIIGRSSSSSKWAPVSPTLFELHLFLRAASQWAAANLAPFVGIVICIGRGACELAGVWVHLCCRMRATT